MTAWVDNEEGPTCVCGGPTMVKVNDLNAPVLLCLFHTADAGVVWSLPGERPADWPENWKDHVK